MSTLNLGILAHVDAGKTSLTERLLHATGVIDEIGSVDDGSTRTDSLTLERARGITIKSAVVSFVVEDTTVNLIDTPGHPDFIAEVERALSVLDGAVLMVSAVEGVQAQTRILMRALARLSVPTLIFVNKTDRGGARYEAVLRDISERLTPTIIPMGRVSDRGTRDSGFASFDAADAAFPAALLDLLTHQDEALLTAYVRNEASVSYRRLRRELAAQTGRALVHPVYFGSAITGAGVSSLIAGITELLPASGDDARGPVAGTVFKVERGPGGEKLAYVRMFSGTVRTRDRLPILGGERKVTAINVFDRGSSIRRGSVSAGQVGILTGLGDVRIGDGIGLPRTKSTPHSFAPPTLETVVLPRRRADRGALHAALSRLAEQDPLIDLRQDDIRQELSVSFYGEVQKEVIQATLADEFGVDVTFRETTTICIERPTGTGAAVETIDTEPNPFLASVGLRVDPAPTGRGVDFRLEVELGSMPFAFVRAVEESVRETLREGIHGWQVTDCTVTMTHSGYWARQSHSHGSFDKNMSSTAGDFRNLTPLVLARALELAGTTVHEPVHRFRLELPPDTLGPVSPVLARLGAACEHAVSAPAVTRGAPHVLEGEVPAVRVHELRRRLPALTRGEGVLESAFDHYRPVPGAFPVRPRSDCDPFDRDEYLRRISRRVSMRQDVT